MATTTEQVHDLDTDYAAIPDAVLADLAAYCFAERTTVDVDAAGRVDMPATLNNEGRRQVYLYLASRCVRGRTPRRVAMPEKAETRLAGAA